MKTLIFDMSNLMHRTFFAVSSGSNKGRRDTTHGEDMTPEELTASLVHHASIRTLQKYYAKFRPDRIVAAFDRPMSWRKMYTTDDQIPRFTPNVYKGNRRQNMTPQQQQLFQAFLKSAEEFELMIREQTKFIAIAQDGLEADDLIAGFVQMHPEDQHVIISADRDFLQLVNDNVTLIEPTKDSVQTLEEFDHDPELFLFQKCLRGDKGDNVISAFPGVRMTRIRAAYEDDYQRVKLMEHKWKLLDVEYRVGDLYEENRLLMDLSKQPDEVRQLMEAAIREELERPKHFSAMAFLRFCGKYQLRNIATEAEKYSTMFNQG